MKKMIFLFLFMSSAVYANPVYERIEKNLAGEILQAAKDRFIKVGKIEIKTLEDKSFLSHYKATITYTDRDSDYDPDCYGVSKVFNKLGFANTNTPTTLWVCARPSPNPMPLPDTK